MRAFPPHDLKPGDRIQLPCRIDDGLGKPIVAGRTATVFDTDPRGDWTTVQVTIDGTLRSFRYSGELLVGVVD